MTELTELKTLEVSDFCSLTPTAFKGMVELLEISEKPKSSL